MNNYIVSKVGRKTKPRFFEDLNEALADAELKSRKNKAEYSVLKSFRKDESKSTYYMEYANFINGKRTK